MGLRSLPVIIEIVQDASQEINSVFVPLIGYNQLNNEAEIKLKVGAARVEVKCSLVNNDLIKVSKKLSEELSLYNGLKTNMIIKDNEICLGPVIGTFTESATVRLAREQRPGNKTKNLNLANKDAGAILYFFSVDDFYSEDETINGTFYNRSTDRWEQRKFPIPDVLYDRGGGILKNEIAPSEYIRQTIENNENVKKFNPRYYFDKLDVYNKLKRYDEMEQYLPLTIQYKGPQDLLMMLEKCPIIYMKDRKGNRGLGVTRIIRYPNGNFELSYFKKELFKYGFRTFDELVNKIDELYKNKKAIIQYSIDVIKINEGNVDMRATVQRDGDGVLAITACPVRVGKAGTPITSTRSGSEVYRFEDFYKKFFNYADGQIKEIVDRVDKFLIDCYKCIEDSYGTFGEIGIDFAIDNKGKVWFIECNAKPGKDTVYLSYDEETVRRAFLNPLEYAKYICGY